MPLGIGIFLTHVSALSNYQLPVIWTLFLSNCSGDSIRSSSRWLVKDTSPLGDRQFSRHLNYLEENMQMRSIIGN